MNNLKQCPKCGQVNAAENTVCVICQTPLTHAAPATAASSQQILAQRTQARKRELRELVEMYMRWSQYTTWCGFVPMLLGALLFIGSVADSGTLTCLSSFVILGGLAMAYFGPKVRKGLVTGDEWAYDMVLMAHWIIYGVLFSMIAGLVVLQLSDSDGGSWVGVICLSLIPIGGMVINWYAHMAFAVATGRRSGRIRRFGPLSDTSGRPGGVKAYTYFMANYALVVLVITIAIMVTQAQKEPPNWSNVMIAFGVGLLLFVFFASMTIGVWRRRAWARRNALIIHGAIGVLGFLGALMTGLAFLGAIGPLAFNYIVWRWFYVHADYFDQ